MKGLGAAISLMITALHLTGLAGKARGIDPGKPGVPEFGKKIYHLRAFTRQEPLFSRSSQESIAIRRKTGKNVEQLARSDGTEFWRKSLQEFTGRLTQASIRSIIFDYDGTLCDRKDRYNGLSFDITDHLNRLLEGGIVIGIATGRGKSVRSDLRQKIHPHLWSQIYLGYYNGAEIGTLGQDAIPEQTDVPVPELELIKCALENDSHLSRYCQLTIRRWQITLELYQGATDMLVWNAVRQLVYGQGVRGVTVLRSSHSIDILAPGVTKRSLLNHIRQQTGAGEFLSILCIGDKGQFPGNDFDLLQEPLSLSVDEVSRDPRTCWNLAPLGYRGVQATTHYLQALTVLAGSARFHLP